MKLLLILLGFRLLATTHTCALNTTNSGFLVNLSDSIDKEALWDHCPEMVIEGNTIHLVWIGFKNQDSPLYYCRSVDLGKTWEKPRILARSKDTNYIRESRIRRLAVDGQKVHIAFYNTEGLYGKIYHILSSDGGTTFSQPKELVSGFTGMSGYQIRAGKGKAAIAYVGDDSSSASRKGLYLLFSGDGGNTFTDQKVYQSSNVMVDFLFEENQIVLLSSYYKSGDYGDYTSQVFISVSNDNSATFKTQIISNSNNGDKCIAKQVSDHYVSKLAKSGNTIHVVFMGYNESSVFTTLYVRSADNGLTFEKPRDINNGLLAASLMNKSFETVAAKNGHVYILYHDTSGKIYLVYSEDNGSTFSQAKNVLPSGVSYVGSTWYPAIVPDPNDPSGLSIYISGSVPFSTRSTDGGKTFSHYTVSYPFFRASITHTTAYLAIDKNGDAHWISEMKFFNGSDKDIFYRRLGKEPDPGNENKSYLVENVRSGKYESTIVPSSPGIEFDSVMTAEAWVKFDPTRTLYEVNIMAKINNSDGIDYNPGGYQLGFRVRDGNMCVNSGLETDKGDFMNWGGCVPYDTLWHHVAFTYDAKAGLNNFKTYLDGKLVVQNTVTGRIIPGQGLLIIGSRAGIDTNAKYELDDIRLWNRVLTQEELMKNQVQTVTGKEEGLKLFLNFDDTFKDISGNGNDAIPINYGKLVRSKFDPPITAFDFFRSLNEVSFNNKTTNGEKYFWDFGNKTTSVLGNPKCVYPAAGEYLVILTASNKTAVTATNGKVTIEGLNRVEPVSAGNAGYCNLLIYGGGLKVTGTTVLLRKNGSSDITGESLFSPATGVLSVEMNLENAVLGKWNVVVKNGTAEMVMKDAFEIVKAEKADTWVSISGRGAILFNRWQSYTLSYGNNGNVDAHSVPVWFAITDDEDLEVEFIDFEMVVSDLAIQKGIVSEITALGPYFKTDVVLGDHMKARVYPFMVPNIPAKSSGSVHLRIKTAKSFQMKVWANPPWVEVAAAGKSALLKSASTQAKRQTAECVMGVIAEGVVDIGTSAVPGVGCLWSAGKWAYQTASNPPWSKKSVLMNSLWNACVTVVDCGINLSGVGAIYKGLGVFMANMGGYMKSYNDCLELMKANSSQNMGVSAVSSFDPNEISGPKGYGIENWIQKNSMVPYTIQFENKSTATAPAHTVIVTDTLDLTKFNLSDFSFGSFGWGDTLRVPTGKFLKEFSVDVDLRPGKNLITRVSGKLDTITGIIRWDFLSLNPATMEIEDDPFLGFLPPNNSTNQGEGFVSYSVGLKPELKTNAKIRNRASIVFDANKPIMTNEFVNTLDTDIPQSRILPLDATIDSRFPVTWAGSDVGSGVRNYSVFVLENDTVLYPWLINTTLTTSDFEGKVGSKYKFYSLATDNVSLNEAEAGYDAQTTITVFSEEFDLIRNELLLYPNPAKGNLNLQLRNAPCGMYVVELAGINGTLYYSALHDSYDLTSGLGINIGNYPPGNYIVRIIYGNRSVSRNISVR